MNKQLPRIFYIVSSTSECWDLQNTAKIIVALETNRLLEQTDENRPLKVNS